MSRYLTDLADVLESAGLQVVRVDGWETRARSSGGYADGRPWCIMWHHTASDTSPENDVGYIVDGSPDAPLANLYLARDGRVWICAAGATNTNGKGGPLETSRGMVPSDAMNTYAIGIEAANNGTGEPWPQIQIDAYFTINNTLAAHYGMLPTDCCTHQVWAPDRKIDPATATAVQGPWRPSAVNPSGSWSLTDVRLEAVARTATAPPPDEDDEMRKGPFLIQATGADGTPAGRVYATDGNYQTIRWLATIEALDGYRWQLRTAGYTAPELAPGAPIEPVDTLAAFGAIIG